MATVEICVARIGRAHGIRGDVILDIRTDEPDQRLAAGTAFDTSRGRLTIASTRHHSGKVLARFEEAPDRTTAEALTGLELLIEVESDARPDDPDEFYDHQLVGLRVHDAAGRHRGEVTSVLHLPSQDLLVVDTGAGERFVPFVSDLVPAVDLSAGLATLADIGGLLDEDDS